MWLEGSKVGDKFKWVKPDPLELSGFCEITAIRDGGIHVDFTFVSGPRKGECAYTILPQDVELVTALDELAAIERNVDEESYSETE